MAAQCPVRNGIVCELLMSSITGKSDGNQVTSWVDTSGASKNGTVWSGEYGVYKEGVTPLGGDAIYFDATGTKRIYVDDILDPNNCTLFVVGNMLTPRESGGAYYVMSKDASASYYIRHYPNLLDEAQYQIDATLRTVSDDRGWAVRCLRSDGAAGAAFRDGVQVDSWSETVSANYYLDLAIGADMTHNTSTQYAGRGLDGHVAAVLVFRKPLTDTEIVAVSAWLKSLYIDDTVAIQNYLPDQLGTINNPNATSTQWAQIASRTIDDTTYQACVYWGADENLVIASRVLGGQWSAYVYDGIAGRADIDLTADWDNHEAAVCEIDADGYLHVAYDHHNDPLRYRRSDAPLPSWAGGLTGALSMLGTNENLVSYPTFFRNYTTGKLYFWFRNGGSGAGNNYLYEYDETTETWASALGLTAGLLVDGESARNAYQVGAPRWGHDGNLWFAMFWRETEDGTTAHDLFAFYHDGTGWKKPDGTSQTIPVRQSICQVVKDTDSEPGYILSGHDFEVAADGRMLCVYEQIDTTRDLRALVRSSSNVWSVIDLGYDPPDFAGTARVLYDPTGDTWEILLSDGVASESSDGILSFKTGSGNFTFTQSVWKPGYYGTTTVPVDRTQWLADRSIYYAMNKRIDGVASSAYLVELNESYISTDTTAPVLTSPSATSTSATTATASVSTDDGNGTLYFLASTNATEEKAAVKAALSQAVTTSGEQTVNVEALDPSTTYYPHFVQTNSAELDSEVVTGAAFTTPEYVEYGDPVAFDGEFSDVTLAQLGNAAVILRVWRVS